MHLGLSRSLIAASLLIVAFWSGRPVAAQTVEPAAADDDAFAKGLAAAQAQQYPLALEYFTAAQKADPKRSEIWFNLGLASSKIPGHEFRALALLEAYLLDVPNTPKRPAIEQLLKQLGIPIEAKLLALLDAHMAMKGPYHSTLEAMAGFRDRAYRSLQEEDKAYSPTPYIFDRHATGFARSGQLEDANTFIERLESYVNTQLSANASYSKWGDLLRAYRDLMAAYERSNNLAKAKDLYQRMRNEVIHLQQSKMWNGDLYSADAASLFACLEMRSRNAAASREALTQWLGLLAALPVTNQYGNESPAGQAIEIIAAAQKMSGDEKAASDTLEITKPNRYDFNERTRLVEGYGLVEMSEGDRTDISRNCWIPENRKRELLVTGLRGFQVWKGDDLKIEAAVEEIKTEDKNSIMTAYEIFFRTLAEAYNQLKLRGKGWQL